MRILASIVAAALLLATPAYATKASAIYKKAEKMEKAGKVIEAFVLYSEASQLEPNNPHYRAKSLALQAKAEYRQMQAKAAAAPVTQAAAPVADTDLIDDAAADLDNISTVDLKKVHQMLPPPEVKLPTGHFDFHLRGTASEVFDKVAERCGLQTSYDSEWTATQKIRFDIEDVSCRDALRAAEAATNAFIVTLSSKLIFISKDTTQKRQANEATMSVVIPIPTALTTQDLTEISQAVKQVSGVEKLAWNSASNEIVIRDRVSRALIAKRVVEQLTAFRGGVLFDLRFLELTTSDMLEYGVNLTNTFNINFVGSINAAINSTNSTGITLNGLITALRQAPYAFAIGSLQQSVIATLTQSNAKTVLATQIRAINGLPATLHVGDKYPVITAGYYGPGSNSSSSSSSTGTVAGAYTPPPSFTYYDLGVSLKVNPMIGNSDLIALDVETEYQLLAGQAVNGIPILANRKLTTRISIHNDEWAVIGGLTDKTDNTSIAGVAGLANIPILGWFFRTKTREKDLDYIVIVMRPHLVGDPPSTHETAPMAVGTETRPLSPL